VGVTPDAPSVPVAPVGDTAIRETTIETAAVDAFTEACGDDNPIHLDEAYAAETTFSSRIAGGVLTAGVVGPALADLPGDVFGAESTVSR